MIKALERTFRTLQSAWRSKIPPKRYFISHAYSDRALVEVLVRNLPRSMEPVIFAPVLVPIDQIVSNPILERIRQCHGLIYLDSPASNSSFWVAMERDYAMRQSKAVYRFEPERNELHRWRGAVLNPTIFSAHSRRDIEVVRQVVALMEQRFIHVGLQEDIAAPKSAEFVATVAENIRRLLQNGGYVVLFWSARAAKSEVVTAELDMALQAYPNRIVIVKIDETQIPQSLRHLSAHANIVDLGADYRQSRLHTIDDLIVRLYWLISQNS